GLGIGVLIKETDLINAGGCEAGRCPPDVNPNALAEFNAMRISATVGMIAGGALAATGLTLVLTAPKARATVGLLPRWGGGSGRRDGGCVHRSGDDGRRFLRQWDDVRLRLDWYQRT